MLIFLLLYSMLEGSHTQQPKGRHQRDTRHRNLLVELSYRPAGDRRQVNTALEESRQHIADRYNNLDIHNNNHHHPEDEQYFHQHHKGHGHTVDRQFTEEDPTPTSTPSVTDEANQGTCTDNSCKMGDCHQVGQGIRICKCMRGYVGHRCSELMVNIADYVEAHPETKKKIKIIPEQKDQESVLTSLNHKFYVWSKKQIKRDQNKKERAKKRQHLNSEEVQNHQIIHSAFQSAFGDKEPVVINSVDKEQDSSSSSSRGDRHDSSPRSESRAAGKQESRNERREPGSHDREKPGRKRHDRRGARNTVVLNRHRRHVPHLFPDINPSDPKAHLVLCIEDCQTVLSYSSQLCPAHKLAVELRIEESDWHHIPVNRVKCCTANVSDTCEEMSQAVVNV